MESSVAFGHELFKFQELTGGFGHEEDCGAIL
jgi:hypothetical protein